MKVRLAYGREGHVVNVPDSAVVLEPDFIPGLPDEAGAIRDALRRPIGSKPFKELFTARDTVAIVFSDLTRPVPTKRILPVMLDELSRVPRESIVLINALGMHRENTEEELREMLGDEIVDGYRIVQHNAHDKERMALLGTDATGAEAWVNAEYMAATKRILTGFIEPHFFAGFSGGPKSVLPGIAGADLVMANHGARNVGSDKATWGVTQGNPVHDQIREVAAMTGTDFILNVALNKHKEITAVFAGEMFEAHKVGIEFVRRTAMKAVDKPFDIVVTTNSGYPLDLNLYQAVKGMTAALQVVREGGAIISVAECSQGLPEHGNFKGILGMGKSPGHLLETINDPSFLMFDQWEAQILARVLMKADVYLYAGGLSEDEARLAHCKPIASVEECIDSLLAKYGRDARICVLPEGPQTVPFIQG